MRQRSVFLLLCFVVLSCERVAPAPGRARPGPTKPRPAEKSAPSPGGAGGRLGPWRGADTRAVVESFMKKCVTKKLVKQFRASHGRSPVIGIAVQVPEADAAVGTGALEAAVKAALQQRGLPVQTGARTPMVYSADPRFALRMSPGVDPRDHDYLLKAEVTSNDEARPGRGTVRRYAMSASLVEIAGRTLVCKDRRELERAPTRTAATDEAPPPGDRPAWVTMAPCVHDGKAYVVGRSSLTHPGKADESVWHGVRKLLSRLARRNGGELTLTVEGLEAPDSFASGDVLYTLVRTGQRELLGLALPACDAARVSSRSTVPAGCPAWVNRVSWREGRKVFGAACGETKDHFTRMRAEMSLGVTTTTSQVSLKKDGFSRKGSGTRIDNRACQEASCRGRRCVLCSGELAAP